MEVGRADALPDDVPLVAGADHGHLLLVHDVLELLPDLAHLAHRLAVDEVVGGPLHGVAVGLPLQVDVEEGQVV